MSSNFSPSALLDSFTNVRKSGHSVILGHSYTGEIYSLVLDTNHCGVGRGIRMWRRGGGGGVEKKTSHFGGILRFLISLRSF